MNADGLLRHYERVADSPEAVGQLRRFVLELAVQGKLVAPDTSDESADPLLAEVARERVRRIAAGEFQEPTSVVRTARDALPFRPAPHWRWVRLIDVAQPSYGFAFASAQFNSVKRGMPLIRIRDISAADTEAYFDGDFDPAYLVRAGDYVVGMDGDFNLRRWSGITGLLNQRVLRLNGWRSRVDPEFIKLPLQFVLDYLHGQTSQTTVKHLSAKQVNGIEIPLPPVAEQHRIVAKVNELMALCDQLEAVRAEREAARDRLTAASLARLNAPDPGTFTDDARFAIDVLPAIAARPDQVTQVRQTILNLAVRGQLVLPMADDEPAIQLLKRMAAERGASDAVRHARAAELGTPFPVDEIDLSLPAGWGWVRAHNATRPGQTITYGILKPEWVDDGVPTVRVSEMKSGTIDIRTLPRCTPSRASKFEKTRLEVNDLLVSKDGTVGKTAFVPEGLEGGNITQHVLRFPVSNVIDRHFVRLFIDSPVCQRWLSGGTKGALQGVNVGDFRRMPIPLPPLGEQRRIVRRVDELMRLCDLIEASLLKGADKRRRLLESLLKEALDPANVHLEVA